MDATGRGAREVVRAFAVVRDGFGLPALYREIDALDNKIDGQVQLDLYAAVGRLVLAASAWDLKNGSGTAPLGAQIAALQEARKVLEPKLASLLPDFTRERMAVRKLALVEAGAPEKLAERLALLDVSALIPDIALVAREREVRSRRGRQGLLRRHRSVPHRPHRGRGAARSPRPTIMKAWRCRAPAT